MGKATIMSHLGDGLYSIAYARNTTLAATRLAQLEQLQSDLLLKWSDLDTQLALALSDYDAATTRFQQALDDWADCARMVPPCPDLANLSNTVKILGAARATAGAKVTSLRAQIAEVKAKQLAGYAEAGYLASTAKDVEIIQAWGIDYAKSIGPIPPNTVVGTIETYGGKNSVGGVLLPAPSINVVASFDGAQGYSAGRDHCVVPLSAATAATVAYNIAQWPYVMANNPAHATGTVTAKSATTLDVALYGTTETSNAPDGYPFDGTYSIPLSGVPVRYQNCDADAFAVGDRVIVQFSGPKRAGPLVIGFADHPFDCVSEHAVAWLIEGGSYGYDAQVGDYVWDDSKAYYGFNHSWKGTNGRVCSFNGNLGKFVGQKSQGSQVAHLNTLHNFTLTVRGACVKQVGGTWYVYALCQDGLSGLQLQRTPAGGGGAVDVMWSIGWPAGYSSYDCAPAIFSPSGDSILINYTNDGWSASHLILLNTLDGAATVHDLDTWGAKATRTNDCGIGCRDNFVGMVYTLWIGTITTTESRVVFADWETTSDTLRLTTEEMLSVESMYETGCCGSNVDCWKASASWTRTVDTTYTLTTNGVVHVTNTSHIDDFEGFERWGYGSTHVLHRLISFDPKARTPYMMERVTISRPYATGTDPNNKTYTIDVNVEMVSNGSVVGSLTRTWTTQQASAEGSIYWRWPYSFETYTNPSNNPGTYDLNQSVTLQNGSSFFVNSQWVPCTTSTSQYPGSSDYRGAFGHDGEFIQYHKSPTSTGVLEVATLSPLSTGLLLYPGGSEYHFQSNNITQSEFEIDSGHTLPYGQLGVIG